MFRSPSSSVHCLHTLVCLFCPCCSSRAEPDAGASIAADCFIDVLPQKKKGWESLSLWSAPRTSCMEVIKMKDRVFQEENGCTVLRFPHHDGVARRGFGEMQVTISAICTTRQTPTLTQVHQEKLLTPVNLLLMHKSPINPPSAP